MTKMIYRAVAYSGNVNAQSTPRTPRTPQTLLYRGVAHISRPDRAARPVTRNYAMIYRGTAHQDMRRKTAWDLATAVAV